MVIEQPLPQAKERSNMCIIVYKPAGADLPGQDIRTMHHVNPHGFGYMYADVDKGSLMYYKKKDVPIAHILSSFADHKDKEVCYHFRYKTRGAVNEHQVHPFPVHHDKDTGLVVWMMHNGTINITEKSHENDTQAFIRQVVRPVLKQDSSAFYSDWFVEFVEDVVPLTSKILFLDNLGRTVFINGSKWDSRGDCDVSNLYSFNWSHRAAAVPAAGVGYKKPVTTLPGTATQPGKPEVKKEEVKEEIKKEGDDKKEDPPLLLTSDTHNKLKKFSSEKTIILPDGSIFEVGLTRGVFYSTSGQVMLQKDLEDKIPNNLMPLKRIIACQTGKKKDYSDQHVPPYARKTLSSLLEASMVSLTDAQIAKYVTCYPYTTAEYIMATPSITSWMIDNFDVTNYKGLVNFAKNQPLDMAQVLIFWGKRD